MMWRVDKTAGGALVRDPAAPAGAGAWGAGRVACVLPFSQCRFGCCQGLGDGVLECAHVGMCMCGCGGLEVVWKGLVALLVCMLVGFGLAVSLASLWSCVQGGLLFGFG